MKVSMICLNGWTHVLSFDDSSQKDPGSPIIIIINIIINECY